MAILKFPKPNKTSPEGILAIGGDLEPESLILAYSQGIFPWPIEGLPLTWFCPPQRAILAFDSLHIPQSLKKFRNKSEWKTSIDRDFKQVISLCGSLRKEGTWITEEMRQAYIELHRLGHAHSIEVWDEDELVGGIYGVDCGGAFAAESMFYKKPNASKLALLALVDHLKERGLTWFDIQVMTPHMEKWGAKMISRNAFLKKLQTTLDQKLKLFP